MNTKYLFLCTAVLIAGIVIFVSACKERNVPYIIDEEQIQKYIEESNIGEQFFRKNNLIMPDTFRTLADPSSLYKIVIDSVRRFYEYSVSEDERSYSFDFLGGVPHRDAEVEVKDRVYYKTIRVSGVDTITTAAMTQFSRYGWFAKVGDDSRPYAGWLLYGYNGGSPFGSMGVATQVSVTAPNNYVVRGDTLGMSHFFYEVSNDTVGNGTKYVYYLITDSAVVMKTPPGVSLDAALDASPTSSYCLITTEVNDAIETVAMPRSGGEYEYSVVIPGDEPSRWYLIVFFDVRSTSTKIWCVPYRIWPD
jgi:hypothetical protein